MNKRTGSPRYVLSDFRAAKEIENTIVIDTDGGAFQLRGPVLWTDDEVALLSAGGDPGRLRQGVEAIIGGADAYERFVAAGGSTALAMAILRDHLQGDLGVELGD